jgi:hypothetical protein
MSFMERQVEHGLWYVVETNHGTDCVPADVCSVPHVEQGQGPYDEDSFVAYFVEQLGPNATDTEREVAESKGENEWAEVAGALRAYVNGHRFDSVELVEGWGARLSAPGYLDCTDWCVFDTEEEAVAYLDETYGEEDDE